MKNEIFSDFFQMKGKIITVIISGGMVEGKTVGSISWEVTKQVVHRFTKFTFKIPLDVRFVIYKSH